MRDIAQYPPHAPCGFLRVIDGRRLAGDLFLQGDTGLKGALNREETLAAGLAKRASLMTAIRESLMYIKAQMTYFAWECSERKSSLAFHRPPRERLKREKPLLRTILCRSLSV